MFNETIDPDPYAVAISYNIHRRHLTADQKRDLIARLLSANPGKSDREIGRTIRADGKTVAAVRHDMESRAEIPHVETRKDTKGRAQPAKKPKAVDAAQIERDRAECIALNNKVLEAETVARFTAHVAAYDAAQAEIEEIRAELAKPVSGQKIISAEQRLAEFAAEEDAAEQPVAIDPDLLRDLDAQAISNIHAEIDTLIGNGTPHERASMIGFIRQALGARSTKIRRTRTTSRLYDAEDRRCAEIVFKHYAAVTEVAEAA